jgi:hypothetical protein
MIDHLKDTIDLTTFGEWCPFSLYSVLGTKWNLIRLIFVHHLTEHCVWVSSTLVLCSEGPEFEFSMSLMDCWQGRKCVERIDWFWNCWCSLILRISFDFNSKYNMQAGVFLNYAVLYIVYFILKVKQN